MSRLFFALLALGALALWIQATVPSPSLRVPTITSLVDSSRPAQTQSASVAGAHTNYMDLTGMILMDTTGGIPIPYIQYVNTNQKVMTKQLVYAGSRACATYAGDLPCVSTNETQAYPQLPTGTNVRVRGIHKDDRILVYQIDVINPTGG